MEEIVEYLHWIASIACKMYLENKPEAKILFEAVRRIAKQINNERSFGIQIFATAFVDPMSDFILSNYPWALIYDSGSKSKYVVRLIVDRCKNCGKDSQCIDLEDCDRVEVEREVNSLDEALNTLAKLYLSYFFSDRAYEDGIGSRIEIAEEYWKIKEELKKENVLINLGTRDAKRTEEIRKRRAEKYKKAHLKLVELVVKDYKNIDDKIKSWKDSFKAELEGLDKEEVNIVLKNCMESLSIANSILSDVCNKVEEERLTKVCKESLTLLNEALSVLKKRSTSLEDKEDNNIRSILEKLNKSLELITSHADELVKADIPDNTLTYDNRLAYGIRSLVLAITCLECLLNII